MRRALVALLAWSAAGAQGADTALAAVERFTGRARAATERFKDLDVAVTEHYGKVGPDFPAMGEHWVNAELIMRGEFDAARPAILTYTSISGKPTLTGVVYALALKRGEKPPMLPWAAGWHDHVGSIDEESLLFGHDHHSDDDMRLVVMHAWIWQTNPAGMFATDNWALPFARVGVKHPVPAPEGAARAIALLSGSASYFSQLFARAGALDEQDEKRVNDALALHREAVEQWWSHRSSSSELTRVELAELSARWERLSNDVQSAVSLAAAARLQPLMRSAATATAR